MNNNAQGDGLEAAAYNPNTPLFADDGTEPTTPICELPPWRIIVADDEEEVHTITRLVLDDFTFEGRGVNLLSAFSGEDALGLVQKYPDTAVILLDVVMEEHDTGLKITRIIREELHNHLVRIVLRTGQPGSAPENKVITEYDINDYKEKTELTAQKLFTTITSALRAYRDLKTIEQNRQGLERIIDASARLFEFRNIEQIAAGIIENLCDLVLLDERSCTRRPEALIASAAAKQLTVIAANGSFTQHIGKAMMQSLPVDDLEPVKKVLADQSSLFFGHIYAGFFTTSRGSVYVLVLNAGRVLTEVDHTLITLFATHIAVAFENLDLNREIVDTQKEVIETLGEVIESRSKETGNHVRRVAEISHLLAVKYGLSKPEAEVLRIASPMHDVGKVGIPDDILLKEAPLSREELAKVRRHTTIGYEILKKSRREIMEAAVIAAQQHHERWDGKGYPRGLKGEQIHIYGRITALADVFDALLHRRIYKAAWAKERVLEFIRREKGRHFDPRLVDLFFANLDAIMAIVAHYPDEAARQP